jgi:hypothetical protein
MRVESDPRRGTSYGKSMSRNTNQVNSELEAPFETLKTR